jgi:gluconolactonase
MKKIFGLFSFIASGLQAHPQLKTVGVFERYDKAVNKIVGDSAKAEIISQGYSWSEGPLWVEKDNMLLFSDVPNNAVYKWTEAEGTQLYLKPSGFNGTSSKSRETGSNGLALDNKGNLVLCQHGNRQMAVMNAPLTNPQPNYTALATNYMGRRFSSPNDCAFNNKGELFFTDPPYGLPSQGDQDPLKELNYNGVFKIRKDGTTILLTDSITRPNGIAFFPGYKKILVACSDPKKPNWYVFDVKGDSLTNGKIFYSAAGYDKKLRGLPDGLKIDSKGNVFATGPGGVYIFNKHGKVLGRLSLPEPTSNCSLSADEKTLFITNNKQVLKFSMR